MQSNNSNLVVSFPHLQLLMGGTKFLFEVVNHLSKRYEVLIVANSISRDVEKYYNKFRQQINIKSYDTYGTNSILYWLFLPIFLVRDVFAFYKIFQQANHAISFGFPSNFICSVNSIICKKEYFNYCYEPYAFFHNQDFINTFPQPKRLLLYILRHLYAPLDRWAARQAAKTFTLNQITQQMIKNVYGVDSIVTLMGVDSEHFSPQKSKKYQQMFPGRKIIAHSTDYTSMKNSDLAVTIMAELVKKYPKAIMLITSTRPNAPEKQGLVNMVRALNLDNNVKFLDLIEYNDLPILYSNALCYLSCSTDKMLGTTSSNLPVKEALACGTPALRANITTEDVVDGYSGFLIDPRESVEVAKKIGYLIDNPKTAKKMGLAGRKRIVKEYKWQQVADIIIREIGAPS